MIQGSLNVYSLKEWAKSRVKKVDFDVHFVSSIAGKERLARAFRFENRLFRWFSGLFLLELRDPASLAEDKLLPARLAMKKLYAHAGRALPAYFPQESIERLYDPGRQAWGDLLHRFGKARLEWTRDRALAHFSEDMQHHEIKEFENLLPQMIKYRRRGKTLVIENPGELHKWLEGDGARAQPWWRRWFS